MRIAYFLRDISDCGGIQQMTVTMLNAFASKGYECTVISLFHKYNPPFFSINSKVRQISLFDSIVDTKKDYFEIMKKANAAFNTYAPELIIVQSPSYACYISRTTWTKYKVVVCEHAYYGYGHFGGLHSIGKYISIRKASAIVTLTKLDMAEYKKHCKEEVILETIYNPCMVEQPTPEYDLESKTIVSCGTLDKMKGFDKSIIIGSKILPYYKEWKWEIYGDGKEKDNLQTLINSNHLESQIILKGYTQNKNEIYSGKSIYVVTSSFEGFGLVIAEAMCYGLPGVSFGVKYGPLELIENQVDGLIVDYNDLDEMAKCIRRMIEDESFRESCSNNARRKAALFETAAIVTQWEELFYKVMRR